VSQVVKDLLNPSEAKLEIRDHPELGTYVVSTAFFFDGDCELETKKLPMRRDRGIPFRCLSRKGRHSWSFSHLLKRFGTSKMVKRLFAVFVDVTIPCCLTSFSLASRFAGSQQCSMLTGQTGQQRV
jgi:hypothetical protein